MEDRHTRYDGVPSLRTILCVTFKQPHPLGIQVLRLIHAQITDSPARAKPRRLGFLAGTFEDGSVTIFAVPLPADVIPVNHDSSKPVFSELYCLTAL
jgi:hypothetical protein